VKSAEVTDPVAVQYNLVLSDSFDIIVKVTWSFSLTLVLDAVIRYCGNSVPVVDNPAWVADTENTCTLDPVARRWSTWLVNNPSALTSSSDSSEISLKLMLKISCVRLESVLACIVYWLS